MSYDFNYLANMSFSLSCRSVFAVCSDLGILKKTNYHTLF